MFRTSRRLRRNARNAPLQQPRASNPVYQDNAVALPLYWGTTGVVEPYHIAKYLYPLYAKAKNGVAYILDDRGLIAKSGVPAVEKAIRGWILTPYREDYEVYAPEAYQGHPDEDSLMAASLASLRQAEKVRVRLTPIVSPATGKRGYKVVFTPPHEQLRRNSRRRTSRRRHR